MMKKEVLLSGYTSADQAGANPYRGFSISSLSLSNIDACSLGLESTLYRGANH